MDDDQELAEEMEIFKSLINQLRLGANLDPFEHRPFALYKHVQNVSLFLKYKFCKKTTLEKQKNYVWF